MSIVAFDVLADQEARFLELMGDLHALIFRKGYGTDELLLDAERPLIYYDVHTWTSDDAAARYEADADVRALTTKLAETMTSTHLVEGARHVPQDRPTEAELLDAARNVRDRAHARFSNFHVGAALETTDGAIVTGCNIENATYGLTICAERVAVFKAIANGHRSFRRVAVVADTDTLTPPCGACRQILWEFGGNLDVVLGNLTGAVLRLTMKDLLPMPFDGRFLDGERF